MGEWVQLVDTLAFSGLAADSKNIRLPAQRVDALMIVAEYVVTDAGIEAGENFQGVVDKIEVGQGSSMFLEARRDELAVLADFIDVGISLGAYSDDMPATTVKQHAYYMYAGPFRLQDVIDPRLFVALNAPTVEFGAASAFTCTMRVHALIADDQSGPGLRYKRNAFASAAQHQILTQKKDEVDLITAVFIRLGALNLDAINYGRNDVDGKPILGAEAIDIRNPRVGQYFYAAHKETALSALSTTHRYIFGTIENPPGINPIVLDCSTTGATALLAWVQGMTLQKK